MLVEKERRRFKGLPLYIATFLLVIGGYLIGALDFVEQELLDFRFRFLQRDASATLVLVEIDGESLDRLGAWPWPRRVHGQLLQQLMAAGAEQVAFDIDFSSPSDEANDAAFEAALAAAGQRVILPVFQQLRRGQGQRPDNRVSLPEARFRQHVSLASINVRPDKDGRIRRLPYAQLIGDTVYPSLATHLAGARLSADQFIIDFGIRPNSVPSISFADILDSSFNPELIRGKKILVGATAVELGDQLAVPLWRVMPGPLLNIIAYESLYQGRTLREAGALPVLVLAAIAAFAIGPLFQLLSRRNGLLLLLAAPSILVLGALASQAWLGISVDIAPAGAALLLSYGVGLGIRLDNQGFRLLRESLSNMHRRALLDRVIDGSSDGLLIVDESGRIELHNGASKRMFGIEDFSKVRIDALFDCRDDQTAVSIKPLLSNDPGPGGNSASEVIGQSATGQQIPLELVVTRVSSPARRKELPDQQHLVCFLRDIAERKRLERLKQKAMEDATRAERSKAAFLATMSHELRTPLNHIIGFSEMLETRMFGDLSDKQAEYIADISTAGHDLLHLISEILEYAAVRDRDYELSADVVSAETLVQDCINKMMERASAGQVELRNKLAASPDNHDVIVDKTKFEQVLLNLVSNSLKFTQAGGQVALRMEHGVDGSLAFIVEDTGKGMSDSLIETALQPFARGEDAFQRTQDGYGLGLPLAKAIIDLHGGEIAITSNIAVGTKVVVKLPASRVFTPARSDDLVSLQTKAARIS